MHAGLETRLGHDYNYVCTNVAYVYGNSLLPLGIDLEPNSYNYIHVAEKFSIHTHSQKQHS